MNFCYRRVVFCALIGAALQSRAQLANGIKAIIHDSVVTYDEVSESMHGSEKLLVRRYYDRPDLLEREVEKLRKDTLDVLVNRQLILHEFKTAGYNLPESVVDEMVEEEIRKKFIDRRTMIRTLNEEGYTYATFRQRERESFIESAMRAKNISHEVIVSPIKIKHYYDAHLDEFKVEDEVKVRILTLPQLSESVVPSARQQLEEALAKLKAGESFTNICTLYAPGGQSNKEGTWYEASQLTKHLSDILAPLKPGEHTGILSRSAGDDYWICEYGGGRPVRGRHYTVAGSKEKLLDEKYFDSAAASTNLPPCREFFLVFLEDRHTAHVKPLDEEVRTKIEQEFLSQERSRLEKQWMEKLKKKTFVRVFPG
ncbi:MAG: hypothetical protein C5B50_14125 [Verrucomicrobia bacterium]|nr:MAG: hypothetical protein C5B50_14125 [Verrucomicrobiota bacterium]